MTIAEIHNVKRTKDTLGYWLAKIRPPVIDEMAGETEADALMKLAGELEIVSDYLSAKVSEIRGAVSDSFK